jgi:hypothetical protein
MGFLMKYFVILIGLFILSGCNLIPHQYKSSNELVANFTDVKQFEFDGQFADVFPVLIDAAKACAVEFRRNGIDVVGAASASTYDVRIVNETTSSARIEIWSVHFIDTYLFEVIDVEANSNKTVAKHYQLETVHTGNDFRLEDLSSWYKSDQVRCD